MKLTHKMPFKLRLKKSRQYNVVSKSLFVICVELLDGNTIECTLSAESTGQVCLDNVCQRLGLQQPEFFGLRYVPRHGTPHLRWVEMDRPLKRQLDKHAREPNLLLRVMYYVSGVNLIRDETTRYHYFLQLKMDVIEGRMNCDAKQAVLLASYSMQAEFGNHDPERHTAEYLKDFAIFPKHLTEQGHLERLTEAVICQHITLAGLAQGTAEEYYILAAQQLDGYGQETFIAKDESGVEVVIGVSLMGIVVGYENTSKFYRWKDITNVVNHKRYFGIECQVPEDTVQFQFSDLELAKYVWRMCVHQHTFFMQHEQAVEPGQNIGEQFVGPLFQSGEHGQLTESREELDNREVALWPGPSTTVQRAQSTSCLDLTKPAEMDRLRALLPSYRPAPDYETAIQLKYQNSNQGSVRPSHQVGLLYSSQPEIHQTHVQENLNTYSHYKQYPDVTRVKRLYVEPHGGEPQQLIKGHALLPSMHTYSTPELDAVENHIDVVQGMQLLQLYKPPPPYPASSNSTPDLASQHATASNQQVSGSSPDLVSSRSLGPGRHSQSAVPSYQLLPDPEAQCTYTDLATNVMYCEVRLPYQYTSGSTEPIYENIPLPWAAEKLSSREGTGVRSRTSSIQSAPEITSSNMQTSGSSVQVQIAGSKSNLLQAQHHHQNHEKQALPQEQQQQHHQQVYEQYEQLQSAHTQSSPHVLASYSLPHPGKNKHPAVEEFSSGETTPVQEQPSQPGNSVSVDGAKQKPKRKWALLGGKNKSKSATLIKEKTSVDKATSDLQHRWSTGLPRLPLPPTISKEAMCQLLEKKLVDSQLFFEFEKIPKKKTNADFSSALHPDNVSRNRYKDVLPYEENRVRLTPSKENKSGYVNASHITATVGSHQRFYIAAQGPMPSTLTSFWQMIWEADVYLVLMLTGVQEEGTTLYCPGLGDRCLELGQFEVWRQFSQETGHCVTTKLRLYHKPSRRVRGIWHLQYMEWGDQGCPHNVGHFLGFLEEVNSVRQHIVSEIPAGHNRNPPVLVHCSAGVGRTGVVILSDLLLFTLDHNQELDIPHVVAHLRHQRMLMVQTIAQYRFIYTLLIYYLKHSRLI